MGNDNSHQSESQKATSSQNSPEQLPSKDRQQELSSPPEPAPVLLPQWDSDIRGGGRIQKDRDEHSIPPLLAGNPSVSTVGSSGDVKLQSAWEEGQLLPTLPLSDLNIAGLEYQESGSSPQTGTIRASFSEDIEEGPTVSEEIGLIGILREWGSQVMPEKIHVETEESEEVQTSSQQDESEFSDALDTYDINITPSTSFEDDANITYAQDNDNNELKISTSEQVILPPQLVPEESSHLASKNSVPAQTDGQLGKTEINSTQEKEASKGSINVQGAQQGPWGFSESDTATADGTNHQTRSQKSLIQVYSTDGSSDRSTPNKTASEGNLDREKNSSSFLDSEPDLMVSEHSAGPDAIIDNPITSVDNPEAVQQVVGAEILPQEHLNGSAVHNFSKLQPQVTDQALCVANSNISSDDTRVNLEDKRTLTDSIHSPVTDQDQRSLQDLRIDSMSKVDNLDINNKPGIQPKLEMANQIVEAVIPFDVISTSFESLKMREDIEVSKVNDKKDNVSSVTVDPAPEDLPNVAPENKQAAKATEDHTTFIEEINCLETIKQPSSEDTGHYDPLADTANIVPLSCDQGIASSKETNTQVQPCEVFNTQNSSLLENLSSLASKQEGLPAEVLPQEPKDYVSNTHQKVAINSYVSELDSLQHYSEVGGNTKEIHYIDGYRVDNICSTREGKLDNKQEIPRNKQESGEPDKENTYLSVSEYPSKLGYTPATQLDNLIKESAPSSDVASTTHEIHQAILTQPVLESCLHFTGQNASSLGADYLAHPTEKRAQAVVEKIEDMSDKTMQKISLGGTDLGIKTTDQTHGSDSNSVLQSSVLSDVETLNLRPDACMEKSFDSKLIQNNLSTTSEDHISHKEENQESKAIKHKEEPLITLSQQETVPLEDTPCLTINKLLREDKEHTSDLQTHPIVCMSSTQLVAKEMDQCDPKICMNPGEQDLSVKAAYGGDMVELPELHKETTTRITSVSCVNNINSDLNKLLEEGQEELRNTIHEPASEGYIHDVPTLGMPNIQLQAATPQFTTIGVPKEESIIEITYNDNIQIGSISQIPASPIFQIWHCETEDESPNGLAKNPTAISSNESLLSQTSGAVSEKEAPILASLNNDQKSTVSVEAEKMVTTNANIPAGALTNETTSSVEDFFEDLPGKSYNKFLGLKASDASSPNNTMCEIKDGFPVQTPLSKGHQSCANGSITNHGELPADTKHNVNGSEGLSEDKQTKHLKPEEPFEVYSGKIIEESLDSSIISITAEVEQTQVKEATTDAQMLINKNNAEHPVENVLKPDGPLEKTKKEIAQEDKLDSECSVKRQDARDNTQNIQLEDIVVMTSLSKDGSRSFGMAPTEQFAMSQHELPEVVTEKSEQILDIHEHKVKQEIHPQGKHPEMVSEDLLNITSDSTEETGFNCNDTSTQNDKVGNPVQEEVFIGSSIAPDKITIPESDSSTQSISEESNSVTAMQCSIKSHDSAADHVLHISPPEMLNSSAGGDSHSMSKALGFDTPQKLDTTSDKMWGSEASVIASGKPETFESLDVSLKEGETTEIVSLEPQLTNKETTPVQLEFVPQNIEIKTENVITEEHGYTFKEMEESSLVPDFTQKETAIISDERYPTPTEIDILFDIPCLSPAEIDILQDIPHITPTETDILSDISCCSPTETDLISDELCLTPETEILSKGSSPVHVELAPKEPNVKAEGLVLAPKDVEFLQEKADASISDMIKKQKDEEVVSEEQNKDLNKLSAISEFQRSTLKSQELGFQVKEHIPGEEDQFTLTFEANKQGSVPLDSDIVPQSPVTRSPVFPTSDSYSFTQKLRSVLHSDWTFPRKIATPTSPEPLVLPSSPRLFGEGAVIERYLI